MRDVPNCLNRRYKALDELIQDLSCKSPGGSEMEYPLSRSESDNPGIKLMCEFWNILKEDPDCNLTQHVKKRMGLPTASSVLMPQRVTCYMAEDEKGKQPCKKENQGDERKNENTTCCQAGEAGTSGNKPLQLSRVLCNLKQAASYDRNCNNKVCELMSTQNELMNQIKALENREKEGDKLLKEADCMWSSMEHAYKKRIADSLEKQKNLFKQLKEVELSNTKWRKNKKELEIQMTNINKCQQEITEKVNQKNNDIRCMNMEIEEAKKRIESLKKEIEIVTKSQSHKQQSSAIKAESIAAEVNRLQKSLSDENKHKYNKEQDGKKFARDAREDLQKISRILLQKKLENEGLRAEKEALLQEIEILNQSTDHCKDRCNAKEKSMVQNIKSLDSEIAAFRIRCIRCNQYTDTIDIRKYCSDCPKCLEERDCLYEDDHCRTDSKMDCVCMSVKQKFLDNVFDNMYTVLEGQTKTGPGKAVAETILSCLKRSRNGKLNAETKKILQDFILTTVKKNLNLTIIGGAVKTRCELDPETYKQLMVCLKEVKTVKAVQQNKETVPKKESCGRWGGTSECNCPSGPKACICMKHAPPPPSNHKSCPPTKDKDNEDGPGEVTVCPHNESTACGADCAMHAVPSSAGAEVAKWRSDPCSGPTCVFSKSMRAAQCVLGPESLSSALQASISNPPYELDTPVLESLITCRCGEIPTKPCTCKGDRRNRPRERIIEEVMGRYIEVSPVEKVTSTDEHRNTLRRTVNEGCTCSTSNNRRFIKLASVSFKQHSQKRSSELTLLEGTDTPKEMLNKKKRTHVCKQIYSIDEAEQLIRLFPNPEPKPKSKDFNTELTAILDPKFHPPNVKMDENTSPLTSYLSSYDSKCNEKVFLDSSVDKPENNSSVSYFGRNVCDTVKDLMKEVIAPMSNHINYGDPEVEWMTVTSFIKKLSSQPKTSLDNDCNITNEEVEVMNETFEESKCSTKYEISSYVKTLLNDLVNSNVSSSQGSFNKTSKRERDYNEIITQQMNEDDSSQNLLSDSSIPINANRTQSHGKCISLFIKNLIRKSDCPSQRIYRCENSQSICNNNNNKSSTKICKSERNPVNLHKYLSDSEKSFPEKLSKCFKVLPEILKSTRQKTYGSCKTK